MRASRASIAKACSNFNANHNSAPVLVVLVFLLPSDQLDHLVFSPLLQICQLQAAHVDTFSPAR